MRCFDPNKKDYLGIKFKKSAIGLWADITKRNINNCIAIVLDESVIAAPKVMSEIPSGNCQISGDFTQSQLEYIVALCSNGELTVNFIVVK